MHRELGNRWGEGQSLFLLGSILSDQGDYDRGRAYLNQALHIHREIGARHGEAFSLYALSWSFGALGNYARAGHYCEESLRILRQTGHARGQGLALIGLSRISHELGDDETAWKYAQKAMRIGRDTAERAVQALALNELVNALMSLGRQAEAAHVYREALTMLREAGEYGQDNAVLMADLARLCLAQEDPDGAQRYLEEVLSALEAHIPHFTTGPFRMYLACYRALHATGDPRAADILETAHRLLQARAAKISDSEERRSFLENVPHHRELVEEYACWRRDVASDRGD